MAVGLASLLVTYGHRPSEITILTMYLGQKNLLQRQLQGYPNLSQEEDSVIISTVDNYQGDENQIVIVSLVRSNPKGTVGFLNERTRRCVAQSRAKSCVIFIGNLETVKRAACWNLLLKKMEGVGSYVGPDLKISCPNHKTSSSKKLTSHKDILELKDKPSLLCDIPCGILFPCGKHGCRATCQPQHDHSKCTTKVLFIFPKCGHVGTKACWKDVTKELCMAVIDFNFPVCGHPEKR